MIEAMQRVADFPTSGREVPKICKSNLREIIYEGVRVVYRIDHEEIVVLLVWHTRRDDRKLYRHLRAYE